MISKELAYEFSVLKWKALSKGIRWGEMLYLKIDGISLVDLEHACGFCEYYKEPKENPHPEVCGDCPLVINDFITCGHSDHPFDFWVNERDREKKKEYAKTILKMIEDSKHIHFKN